MLIWFPVQLYFIYKFFHDEKWKIGFKKRHWFFRGFVYLMIASGIWNIVQLALLVVIYFGE